MPTVAPLDIDGHCITAVFLDDVPHFAFADGAVHRLDHGHKTVQANDGLLTAFHDTANDRLVTGGEDGKVFSVKANGVVEELATAGRKLVTSVAAGPQGAIAYGVGKSAVVRVADGQFERLKEVVRHACPQAFQRSAGTNASLSAHQQILPGVCGSDGETLPGKHLHGQLS